MRAPELTGQTWLNTGGKQIKLAELRGRIVLLDFWTSGCINCLHVLDELRPLEEEFADVLVTVGVHSPKFLHEGETSAIEAAVERYGVHHPVLNDPDLTNWQQYAVKAWPTLVVVDPEGYVVHVAAGEGHAEALRRVLTELVSTHEAKGTLRRGGSPYVPVEAEATELRFPSKAVVTAEGRVLVADTANHSIAEFASDAETLVRRFGSGERGEADGAFDVARFAEPSGLALLPAEVAEKAGYHLVVADTANHRLRGVDLRTGGVTTVAGTGAQWRDGSSDGPALDVDLTSPWDVRWWDAAGGVVVAMAGNHTLGLFDPVDGTVSRFAGTTVEGLRDGKAAESFFAQTSGLAVGRDRLWLVDAETSSLRWIEPAGDDFAVFTAVGTDLFSFGHRDGKASQALLQHPLGVAVLADGTVAIADTYNGAIRRYDPASGEVGTLASGLAEPAGLVVTDAGVLVVETAAHRLRRLDVSGAGHVEGEAHAVRRPPTVLAPGELDFTVVFVPPPGERLDDRFGPSTRLEVSASPPELLADGGGGGTDLTRTIKFAEGVTEGVLQIVAQAASCDSDAEHPACRVTRQDWGVPIRLQPDGEASLRLVMAGNPAT
ncbi:NHL domain-containing thioredoxin family protein [Prauserella cavernicola]|uniref:Redoxin domain-containing protein n=1 Tax=Prauserella cavernicola TaxID=2800127 RepID=A0A934QRB3_9PSEU|nr:NHL domain-containing thioredoxin family protein [Prauserella cavernicola]MBK1784698.1 redoxin domain-containing protein [Prauserella cavernicola]